MDWLFIQYAAANALIFAVIGTFMIRVRHKALQQRAGTDKPFPMVTYFLSMLIGMFLFANLVSYLVRNVF